MASPGILLVTPAIAVSTADVFAVFEAIRNTGDGAVRQSSVHLAEELRGGLGAADLAVRAGVLAMANDLLPATALVVPALVPFRRAISRRLGVPIGQSGSGPTLWALYASRSGGRDRRRRRPRRPGQRGHRRTGRWPAHDHRHDHRPPDRAPAADTATDQPRRTP